MEKNYVVAYISSMEDQVKEELNKIGFVESKHEFAHCFQYISSRPKIEISNISGVLYVEEDKEQ